MPVALLPVLYVPPEEGASKAAAFNGTPLAIPVVPSTVLYVYRTVLCRPLASHRSPGGPMPVVDHHRYCTYIVLNYICRWTEDPYRSYTYPVGRSRPASAFLSLGVCSHALKMQCSVPIVRKERCLEDGSLLTEVQYRLCTYQYRDMQMCKWFPLSKL